MIGFTQCDNKGNMTFYIRNPQPYKENNKFYPSHVHFIIGTTKAPNILTKVMYIIYQMN